MNTRFGLAAVVAAALSGSAFGQTFFGPTPYLQHSDSPFFGLGGLLVDDLEDHVFNLPFSTTDAASLSSAFGTGLIDSVDVDDGSINGVGNNGPLGTGEALWGGGSIDFIFGSGNSALPEYAGLVWTDGGGIITFEAWGENDQLLGSVVGDHADGDYSSGTAEDRFYGVRYSGGISRIRISNTQGGVEADHIQIVPVPEPTSVAALALGALAVVRRKRKHA